MSLEAVLGLCLLIVFMVYMARRLLVLLHLFQQEEYDSYRFYFIAWRKSFALFDLHNPCKSGKKPLVMTARAKRIHCTSCLLVFLVFPIFSTSPAYILILLISFLIVFPAFFLIVANWLLSPYEAYVQHKYWREAHQKLMHLAPVVIGITGSYGKTSVKHILGHVLSAFAPTLITPGSVNTPMGITRIIREKLESRHKYFIVEMGAYGLGSIARLCDLAPPAYGVVTAIGPAHLERFGSLDITARAKAELALAADKKVILPRALLECTPFACLYESNPHRFVICEKPLVMQTLQGLSVEIEGHILEVPLFGLHHGDNVALAYCIAKTLGMDPVLIKETMRSVPQIEHRLAVTTYPTGATLIDDAYNANPEGLRSALDLLNFLGQDQKRRVLITPGVVELGAAHTQIHYDLGAYAASRADVIITVAAHRIPSFVEGAHKAGAKNIIQVARFAEARDWMNAQTGPQDIILIANDLPDVLENTGGTTKR